MRSLIAAAAAIALLPATANAAGFVNGSFESGIPAGSFTTVGGGNSAAITGWTVTGNSVDYIGSYWTAQNLSRSIDLNGNGQGGIQQTFDTVANTLYNVSFWLAGNPDGAPITKTVLVGATGADSATYSFNFTGFNKANMGWTNFTYSFVAQGASTTLSFASQDAGSYGAALDNVSVTAAVPEPGTWAMVILGFAVIGGAMRRRRAQRSEGRLVRA
ncbi:choice-of-anchor C family PEP-CTERM protein [Sphingopyxis sp. H050]|jgi:choice-of-anchor C domain-containing protein|uniref:choice-of-anchor C family PEP-CTERM protein n=1 Tax=Sphingopyxis sp. H050 TaxID=1759072 RepID=UPI0009E7A258|nr:choice-of-anchor C family protein [Sphingopyxis sp. H050]